MIRVYYTQMGGMLHSLARRCARCGALSRHYRVLFSMRRFLLGTIVLVLAAGVGGCVYQAPLSQGNLLQQEDIDQLEVGMTRSQVRFLLGTPMIDDPFHEERWDYVYYLRVGRDDPSFTRWITVIFDGDTVAEIQKHENFKPDA